MWQELKILLIDDNKKNHNDLKLILDFMGEDCLTVTSENYEAQFNEPETILAVIIGEIGKNKNDNITMSQKIIKYINQLKHKLPLLALFPETKKIDVQNNEFYTQFLGKIIWPTGYANLLDVLHRCQLFHNNHHAIKKEKINNSKYRTLVGNTRAIRQVRHLIDQVSESDATVLILGESGTGKEVVAQHVHELSMRGTGPFVPVNCGAIPGELLESELFGHEKGAFTGAISARQGRFEMARGGTLFLDEIGDMPHNMQVKLLRVLQEKTFERVGSNKVIEADVRIIAATNCNLEKAIADNKFREDLYYRLNVFPIELPALTERCEDIPIIINDLLTRLELEGKGTIRLMPRATAALCQYSWPGNIRELANLIERLVILYPHGMVDQQDLPKKFWRHHDYPSTSDSAFDTNITSSDTEIEIDNQDIPEQGIDLKKHLHHLELKFITEALHSCNGIVSHAAQRLNMRRTTLVEKMKKYGIERNESSATN